MVSAVLILNSVKQHHLGKFYLGIIVTQSKDEVWNALEPTIHSVIS